MNVWSWEIEYIVDLLCVTVLLIEKSPADGLFKFRCLWLMSEILVPFIRKSAAMIKKCCNSGCKVKAHRIYCYSFISSNTFFHKLAFIRKATQNTKKFITTAQLHNEILKLQL